MGATKLKLEWTPKGKDYWSRNAIYSDFLEKKYDELVPSQGIAKTVHGELVRTFNKLQHDYCNNGNGNAREVDNIADTCWDCMGSGEDDEGEICDNCMGSGEDEEAIEKVELNYFFVKYIDYLEKYLGTDIVEPVRDMILGDNHCNFTDEYMAHYTKMGDSVAHYMLEFEDEPNNLTDYYS